MTITYKEFIAKYQGKFVDWDGAYGAQCVDLFRQFCHEVLEITQPKGVIGAKDFWDNYDTDPALYKNFEKIPNTPEFVPQPGDVWIWTAAYGKYGHIAIESYATATTSTFQCFSQNDPVGSPCILKTYKYTKVYGVLRPKNQQNIKINSSIWPSSTQGESMTNIDWSWFNKQEVDNWDSLKKLLIEYLGEKEGKCAYGDPETVNHGYLGDERRKVSDLEAKLQIVTTARDEWRSQAIDDKELEVKVTKLESELNYTIGKIEGLEEMIASRDSQIKLKDETIKTLQAKLEAAQSGGGKPLWEQLMDRLKELLS